MIWRAKTEHAEELALTRSHPAFGGGRPNSEGYSAGRGQLRATVCSRQIGVGICRSGH